MLPCRKSARVKVSAASRVHPDPLVRRVKINRRSRVKQEVDRRVNRIVLRARIALKVAAGLRAIGRKGIVRKEDPAEAVPKGVRIAVVIGIVGVEINGVSAISMPTSSWKD